MTDNRGKAVRRAVIEPASCTLPVDAKLAGTGSPLRTRAPEWLLEPDAWKAGKSGSEGASAQQCVGATRQAGLVLGELEGFLDTPTGSGDADEFRQWQRVAGVADVVGQLGGLADRPADQQQVLVCSGIQE